MTRRRSSRSEEALARDIFGESRFMRWLAEEHAAGRAHLRRLRTRDGRNVLEVDLTSSAARRFALGEIGGMPFIGIQPGDLQALSEIPWTHSEARRSPASASITLCGRAPNALPIRVAIPANPEGWASFLPPRARHIQLRRVTVAPHGRVSRISRRPARNLKLVRRGQMRGHQLVNQQTRPRGGPARGQRPATASPAATNPAAPSRRAAARRVGRRPGLVGRLGRLFGRG